MTESYPPNSHKSRENPLEQPSKRETEKKIDKVVTGEVVRRKKSAGSRFRSWLSSIDIRTVGEYVLQDVLIPAAKDMVSDAVVSGSETILFGESRRAGRRSPRGRSRHQGNGRVYTSYDRYSRAGRDYGDRPPYPPARETRRRPHDFDEILLATRAEADEVINRLIYLIDEYESASVRDLNEMLGLSSQYTDDNWGWTDMRRAEVRRVTGGYLLDLPIPTPLN